jgi:23S rRNA (cytidine1920-2'-O)/16S rRNA (cytidine1409-2'-O)-methyltransferase
VKRRADLLLLELGLAPSRAQAQALIMAGQVYLGEERVDKPGQVVASDARLTVRRGPRFVSRGGDKLDGALDALSVDLAAATVLDIGASTGGFTDCVLQRGAARVIAVDVGRGQLAHKLRDDPRVTNWEGVNARYLKPEDLPCDVDWVVVDASFIGLDKLLPAITALLRPGRHLLALVKPQFEAGRDEARRARGVIRDAAVREASIARVRAQMIAAGFEVLGECDSPLPGPKGNLERFVLARRRAEGPTGTRWTLG